MSSLSDERQLPVNPVNPSVKSDPYGRCLVIKLNIESKAILLLNLYLPYFESSADYRSELTFYLGFIEDILESASHTDIVILWNTNFPVNIINSGFSLMNSLLQNFGITLCDDLLTGTQRFTYVNEALNSSFCIDHCFLSKGLRAVVSQLGVHYRIRYEL